MKIDKKIILSCLFLVVSFSACTKKNVATIKPYESFYSNQTAKKQIVFNGVKDDRLLPVVSYIMKGDRVLAKFLSNQNIKEWYQEAYKREFHATDMILDQQQRDPRSTIVQINLKDVIAKYHKDILTKANLEGKVSLEITLKKGNKIVKKIVNTSQSEYKLSIRDAEGFEKFMHTLMSDSVAKSTAIIIETMDQL